MYVDGIRGSLIYIAEKELSDLTIAEIGVRDGENAVRYLKTLSVSHLYCVDNFPKYSDGLVFRGDEEQRNWFKMMFANLLPFKEKVTLIHQPSHFASTLFPDEFFDVVYIDGDHSYAHVIEDLQLWWKKIKFNGYLTGHDYGEKYQGVMAGVNEFVESHHVKPILFSDSDWLIRKI